VNLRQHRVSFEEQGRSCAIRSPCRAKIPGTRNSRFVTLGATQTGKLLVVVYAYAGDADIRLISAREASRVERSSYADEPRGRDVGGV
jgi:uncharacterized DUF497 family protein